MCVPVQVRCSGMHAARTHSCWLICVLRYELLLAHDPLFLLAVPDHERAQRMAAIMQGAALKVRLGAGGATNLQGRLKQGLGEWRREAGVLGQQ